VFQLGAGVALQVIRHGLIRGITLVSLRRGDFLLTHGAVSRQHGVWSSIGDEDPLFAREDLVDPLHRLETTPRVHGIGRAPP